MVSRPALILAFLFAIDPGLVALSRLAGGVILAVAFLLFAWGFWINKRFILAGIFAGLALLSGTSIWMGLIGLGLTWLFIRGLERKPLSAGAETNDSEVSETEGSSASPNVVMNYVSSIYYSLAIAFIL